MGARRRSVASPGPSGWFACLQDVTESAADAGSPPTGRGHERAGRVDPFYVVARQRCPNRWSIPFRLELFVFARSGPVLVLAPLLAVLTLAGCGPKKTTTPAPSTATTAPGRGSSSGPGRCGGGQDLHRRAHPGHHQRPIQVPGYRPDLLQQSD